MTHVTVFSLPVLSDNYIHVLVDSESAVVIDPAEAKPVKTFLDQNNLQLVQILLTHHHADHTGGVKELKLLYPDCEVIGYSGDSHRLPTLNRNVLDGDPISVAGNAFEIWHLPGHTTGHIAYISRNLNVAFTGDVLFGMGCGRVFEGTYHEMFQSLQRLKTLDPKTKIYCTHEYTVNNGRFSLTVCPHNDAIQERLKQSIILRERGTFTVPLMLGEELKTNLFLMAKSVDEFSKYRDARNQFNAVI